MTTFLHFFHRRPLQVLLPSIQSIFYPRRQYYYFHSTWLKTLEIYSCNNSIGSISNNRSIPTLQTKLMPKMFISSIALFSHLLIGASGGVQAFANPLRHHRRNFLGTRGISNSRLWGTPLDTTGGGAIVDLDSGSRSSNNSRKISSLLKDVTLQESATTTTTTTTTNGSVGTVVTASTTLEPAPPTPLPPPSTESNTGTIILANDEEFIKSLPDKRSYRAITLSNQLTVLLVSDPTTDVEAASVHVRAGHFDDPPNRAGLAHFHEHMLFLGTEKYPKENDYEDFLGKNGGMSNAFTDMEDTNYYFNVSPLNHGEEEEGDDANGGDGTTKEVVQKISGVSMALSGALDRFAQFFISPLFDQSMLERELRAVNSEYLNGRTADNWRNFQLLKQGASHDHPFSKFGCGNYNTLTDGGDAELPVEEGSLDFGGGTSPRDDLIKFWTEKYHAGNLRLCVVGRASLDDLQSTVESTFGAVRPPPPSFVANGIVDKIKAGYLKLPEDGETHVRDDNDNFVFQTEHSTYSPSVAFGPNELGLLREVIPLVESRTLKIFSAVPPMDDPVLRGSRPFRVLSHLVGHESPGSLHHLLMEEGWINSLSSGTGISTTDFCLTNIAITLTPKGMKERDKVLAKTWQWFSLIKDSVMNDPHGVIEQYHDELKTMTELSFKFREMGDPTDFCSAVAGRMFDYEPSKVLLGSAEVGKYDADTARAFLDRLTPQNSLVVISGPEAELEDGTNIGISAHAAPWQVEERYGARYRQSRIPEVLAEEWNHPPEIDNRLRLPGLNEFIPKDLSLRADDAERIPEFDPDVDYRKIHPKLLFDTPNHRMWHKMDRTFRVPRTSIKLQLTSPNIYRSPRTITLNRIFQKVLSDDLNSYVYDASVAGCSYRVDCVPSAYLISVSGYSEKIPHLLDVVTNRIASLIDEMKEGEDAHPALAKLFHKAEENLLRQTKNYVYDSPYETGSYNLRMLCESPAWHITDYIGEMEGPDAEADPLTMKECAEVAEQCLFGRLNAVSLCIGNIDEKGSHEVEQVISDHFLKKRPLVDGEIPRFRSLRLPSMAESAKIFGSPPEVSEVPIVYESVAYSEDEENNSVELMIQTASSYELGFEGLAIQELIGSIAYNSAFNQLRTKEQLGYIVSAFVKKITGGGNAFCVLVQSSNTLPPQLEDRCLKWVKQFREELEEMPDERFVMEAAAVKANLLEKDIKLSEEISSVWGEILATVPHSEHFKNPVFDRIEKFAEVLTLKDANADGFYKSGADLKQRVLQFYDEYIMSPDRRAVSSRVYNRKARNLFEQHRGKAGVISSYADARKLKQQLASYPTAPYW